MCIIKPFNMRQNLNVEAHQCMGCHVQIVQMFNEDMNENRGESMKTPRQIWVQQSLQVRVHQLGFIDD